MDYSLKSDEEHGKRIAKKLGGSGSGDFGHEGRPGEVGGSGESSGMGRDKNTTLKPGEKYEFHFEGGAVQPRVQTYVGKEGKNHVFKTGNTTVRYTKSDLQSMGLYHMESKPSGASIPPLRKNANFGDEVVFKTGGETLRGTVTGKNDKGEFKIVTNSGTIHYRNKSEIGSAPGGYRQKSE